MALLAVARKVLAGREVVAVPVELGLPDNQAGVDRGMVFVVARMVLVAGMAPGAAREVLVAAHKVPGAAHKVFVAAGMALAAGKELVAADRALARNLAVRRAAGQVHERKEPALSPVSVLEPELVQEPALPEMNRRPVFCRPCRPYQKPCQGRSGADETVRFLIRRLRTFPILSHYSHGRTCK